MAVLTFVALATAQVAECDKGLSLLSRRTEIAPYCEMQTGIACPSGGCGSLYPTSPEVCYASDRACSPAYNGNCRVVTKEVTNGTNELITGTGDCGYYECLCVSVNAGECNDDFIAAQYGEKWRVQQDMTMYNDMVKEWELVGGEGNHACRGDSSNDNSDGHYTVKMNINSLYGCKTLCENTAGCNGIEYSPGRCELWTRRLGIWTYKEIPLEKGNFTCMRYGWPTSKLEPVESTATHPCRGRSSTDNYIRSYWKVWKPTASSFQTIEECKAACSSNTFCAGIEWSYGRCEVWQVPILSFQPSVTGFTCLRFPLP